MAYRNILNTRLKQGLKSVFYNPEQHAMLGHMADAVEGLFCGGSALRRGGYYGLLFNGAKGMGKSQVMLDYCRSLSEHDRLIAVYNNYNSSCGLKYQPPMAQLQHALGCRFPHRKAELAAQPSLEKMTQVIDLEGMSLLMAFDDVEDIYKASNNREIRKQALMQMGEFLQLQRKNILTVTAASYVDQPYHFAWSNRTYVTELDTPLFAWTPKISTDIIQYIAL